MARGQYSTGASKYTPRLTHQKFHEASGIPIMLSLPQMLNLFCCFVLFLSRLDLAPDAVGLT
eukprot:11187110-Prorocentrum_lima.AAC.1